LVAIFILVSCHSEKAVAVKSSSVSTTKESSYTASTEHTVNTSPPSQKNDPPNNRNDAPKESSVVAKYASLLDVSKRDITNSKLYNFIDSWYGTPYKYAGRTKSGVDCSDFTVLLFKHVYDITLAGNVGSIYKLCTPIKASELREGDLVFFKINKKSLSHVGVYLQNHKFVHASVHSGVVIDDLKEDYYKKYFYKAGRIIK